MSATLKLFWFHLFCAAIACLAAIRKIENYRLEVLLENQSSMLFVSFFFLICLSSTFTYFSSFSFVEKCLTQAFGAIKILSTISVYIGFYFGVPEHDVI